MSMILNVEILGEFKKLTAATQGSTKELTTLSGQASKISKSMNKAFAAIGIGLSFRVIANELEQMSEAAIADRKSMEILALAMKNTTDATDDQIKAAEKSITKLSLQAGIADDELRPAFQKLYLATGNVTESQDLLAIALDASAGTGKSLDVVTQAMSKALEGSDTALLKLIPSLKGSKDPINEMRDAFAGAAEKAANLDPYQKLQVAFGEVQEKLGTALLPVLDKFSAWLASPGGQMELQKIVDSATDILTGLSNVALWALDNKDWLAPLAGAALIFGATITAIGKVKAAIDAVKVAQDAFNLSAKANPYIIALGAVAGVAAYMTAVNAPAVKQEANTILKNKDSLIPQLDKFGNPVPPQSKAPVNVTINTPKMTAQEITNTINKYQSTGGTGLINRLTR